MPEGAVYVGRPTRWGNPYRPGTRVCPCPPAPHRVIRKNPAHAVEVYRWFLTSTHFGAHLLAAARTELAGKNLACWCPLVDEHDERVPCHADVLLELANPGIFE